MLFTVTLNGVKTLVDAPSKAAAKNHVARSLEIEVENASAADISENAGAEIPVVRKAEPKAAATAA